MRESTLLNKSTAPIRFVDIEDKGTSGETFLAAVEYLEQEQPKVAIFENVQNAPWGKVRVWTRLMQHEFKCK